MTQMREYVVCEIQYVAPMLWSRVQCKEIQSHTFKTKRIFYFLPLEDMKIKQPETTIQTIFIFYPL